MKKVILAVLITSTSLWAQPKSSVKSLPRLYVTTPTVAYNNENQSKAVGIFLRGALVDKYENVNYSYKVFLANGETVYITDTYNLKNSLNANDTFSKSPSVVIEEDDYYGSPHLFTTAAGLKVRENINGNPIVVGTLLNGTVVPLEYYSYNAESWVSVEIEGKKGFIPQKHIGQRPILDNLISEYKKVSTPEDQKKYAERILELGWNSSSKETAKALKIYADYAKTNNQTDIADLALLQAKVLENIDNDNNNVLAVNLLEKKQFGFTFNNELEPEKGFKLATLEKFLGKITKSYTDLDDCGLGDYEGNVFFEKAECISHDVNKTYILRNLMMTNSNGFKIKDTILNENTTEKEFLKLTTGLVSYINSQTSSYYIPLDYASYEFTFKKGHLYKVSIIYYC